MSGSSFLTKAKNLGKSVITAPVKAVSSVASSNPITAAIKSPLNIIMGPAASFAAAAASSNLLSSDQLIASMQKQYDLITDADLNASVVAYDNVIKISKDFFAKYGTAKSQDTKRVGEIQKANAITEGAKTKLCEVYKNILMYTIQSYIPDVSMLGTLPAESLTEIINNLNALETQVKFQAPAAVKNSIQHGDVLGLIAEYKNAAKTALSTAASNQALADQQKSQGTKSLLIAAGIGIAAIMALKGK